MILETLHIHITHYSSVNTFFDKYTKEKNKHVFFVAANYFAKKQKTKNMMEMGFALQAYLPNNTHVHLWTQMSF